MATYLVAYDLLEDESEKHYVKVISQIMLCGTAKEVQRSVWVVSSNKSYTDIRDQVAPALDDSDKLLVARFDAYASRSLAKDAAELISASWGK